jgi:hypothetical protein
MKVYICTNERWPDFVLTEVDDFGDEVEVTPLTALRWIRVTQEYDKIQHEMSKALREVQ